MPSVVVDIKKVCSECTVPPELQQETPRRAGRLHEEAELELGCRALIYNVDINSLTFLPFLLKIFL